jgi:hypothetical protein
MGITVLGETKKSGTVIAAGVLVEREEHNLKKFEDC